MKIAERVDLLFDLLNEHPQGVTLAEIMPAIQVRDKSHANRVIRAFRLMFAKEKVNLTATPQGPGEEWLYTLGAEPEVWAANRVGDTESRLETMAAVMQSVVNATDGRTLVGRKARKMEVAFRHLQEDLDSIAADFQPTLWPVS